MHTVLFADLNVLFAYSIFACFFAYSTFYTQYFLHPVLFVCSTFCKFFTVASEGKGLISSMTSLPKGRTLPYPFEKGGIAGMSSLPKGRVLPYPFEKGGFR